MIDEDCSNNSHNKHAQTTTKLVSEEIADEVVSEISLEDLEVECFTQDRDDLNVDKFLEQAKTFTEPSLEELLEELFDQFGDDLDLDKLLDHVDTFSEPSLDDPSRERFDQIGYNLDLDKFLK